MAGEFDVVPAQSLREGFERQAGVADEAPVGDRQFPDRLIEIGLQAEPFGDGPRGGAAAGVVT